MERLRFGQLPLIARAVIGISLFNMWWSFEEFVIDRSDFWKYMPDYKVGHLCVWDLTVATLIVAGLLWRSVKDNRTGTTIG